ncbi:MAG: hypothetical protein HC793_03405, partial [Aquincola sp.]|nr:hypothetical protein [Aquincola sp.]
MNKLTNLSPDRRREVLQERFARRVAAALTEHQVLAPQRDAKNACVSPASRRSPGNRARVKRSKPLAQSSSSAQAAVAPRSAALVAW